MDYKPLQWKGIITAYTGKRAFNVGGITLHYALYIPFNRSEYFPLNSEKLDSLTKHFEQLHVLLVDEACLIRETFLYEVEKSLQQIKHTPTFYFGNVNLIFYGDLQAQPIRDSMIFEEPLINKQKITYTFWQDEVKCCELQTTMHQKDIDFIGILNKMRLNKQSEQDIEYMNCHCHKTQSLDQLFPYIFLGTY
jgi:hypothetical protein